MDQLKKNSEGGINALPQDLDFNAGQSSILSNKIEPQPKHIYRAHWQIFAPTFIICVLYVAGWVVLFLLGGSGHSLARLFIVVLAVGVPFLFAYAFLRYQTISIEIFEKHLRYHTGWPKADPVVIPYGLIKGVIFSKRLSGRLFGGGTIVLKLDDGVTVKIVDVKKPDEAKENIAAMIK